MKLVEELFPCTILMMDEGRIVTVGMTKDILYYDERLLKSTGWRRNHTAIGRLHFHSNGGYIGHDFIINYPHLITGFIVLFRLKTKLVVIIKGCDVKN